MKRYLNRTEKESVTILSAFIIYLEDFLEVAPRRDKQLFKWIRMAKSFTGKALDCFVLPLDDDEKIKIISESTKLEITANYRKDALREHQKIMELNSTVPVKKEDFLDIVEQAIGVCQLWCKKAGYEADSCHLKKLLIKYDIEPLDLESPPGKCPYQY